MQHGYGQNPKQSRARNNQRRRQSARGRTPRREYDGSGREPFGHFVQKHRDEDQQPDLPVHHEGRRDGSAVEERVNREPADGRVCRRRAHDRLRVRLLAEVKVLGYCVFKKVDEKIAAQQKRHRAEHAVARRSALARPLRPQNDHFRHYFYEYCRQHEARAKSHKVA